eukprot:8058145-Ditylum_brightwellii.AAC.1
MMLIVALLVTEAELYAAAQCDQGMMCALCIISAMGLKVKLTMILYLDKKDTKDCINNWSTGGHARYIEVKQYFLRELKEANIIVCKWKKGNDM